MANLKKYCGEGWYLRLVPSRNRSLRNEDQVFIYFAWKFSCSLLGVNKSILHANSVTRLGDFWTFLLTNFLSTVAQMDENSLGYFETIDFQVKSVVATFWATFWRIRATLYFSIWSHYQQSSLVQSLSLNPNAVTEVLTWCQFLLEGRSVL